MTIYQKIKKIGLLTMLCSAIIFTASKMMAKPQGGTVVAGNIQITRPDIKTMKILQKTQKGIIEWKNFNINADELTQFVQPNKEAITLNRISGASGASQINGRLNANGRVILINPAGVIFGKTAKVDVNGILATSHRLSNNDFLNNRFHLKTGENKFAKIINQGKITVGEKGFAALVAPHVINEGIISANLGNVVLASGDEITLDFYGDELIQFSASNQVNKHQIDNSGMILAPGGRVLLTTHGMENAVDNVINHSGIIEANTIKKNKGEIILFAKGDKSQLNVSGTLLAKGSQKREKGGFIETSANSVNFNNPTIDVSSRLSAAGTWLIDPIDIDINATLAASVVSSLAGGSNVTIRTNLAGSDAGNITMSAPIIVPNTVGTPRLRLRANNDISLTQAIIGDFNLQLFSIGRTNNTFTLANTIDTNSLRIRTRVGSDTIKINFDKKLPNNVDINGGGGNDTLDLSSSSAIQTVNTTGNNRGTINGLSFTRIENIIQPTPPPAIPALPNIEPIIKLESDLNNETDHIRKSFSSTLIFVDDKTEDENNTANITSNDNS